ncbi:DUF2711 domain-containing protein [Bacillus siamensis]|nr:DUF2711 domain-containing protein [Bacillus siamensis]MED0771621.1 DUF2711 domain-containing protein [Bacillus siamensis]MED0777157.1 DUF2711 domain-containing protein [Bacillus siamensis]MED0780209.1 DUF2711 domain-containing protein [Bacillus siamensis]MED0833028.1 DUF2711 domain-containing protein [Bacillus siamensis]
MLETLHFEEGVPILRQLPKPFTSTAFLLHPFNPNAGWVGSAKAQAAF